MLKEYFGIQNLALESPNECLVNSINHTSRQSAKCPKKIYGILESRHSKSKLDFEVFEKSMLNFVRCYRVETKLQLFEHVYEFLAVD